MNEMILMGGVTDKKLEDLHAADTQKQMLFCSVVPSPSSDFAGAAERLQHITFFIRRSC